MRPARLSRLPLYALALLVALALPAAAQNCGPVSTCPTATLPYTGSELVYLVQGGASKKALLSTIQTMLAGLTVGSTGITNGTTGRVLFDNAGVLGEKAVTGTGSAVLADSPVITTAFTATNLVTVADLAKGGAATLLGNPTASLANQQAFTIQGLSAATVSGANDFVPIYNAATGQILKATPAALVAAGGSSGLVYGGRLTPQSGHPVQNADQTGVSTIYYAPCAGAVFGCAGNQVPILNGSGAITMTQFTSSATDVIGQSLALNASAQLSGNVYDIYDCLNGSTLTEATGPAWASSAAGSSSRGATAAIVLVNGVWVNNLSMTMKFGASSFTCPAQQGTWLGAMYATANGQTSMTLKPTAVAGGNNNYVGLCNANNRTHIFAKNQDLGAAGSGAIWTVQVNPPGQFVDAVGLVGTSSPPPGAGANNRINFLDCTGAQQFTATIRESGAPGDANPNALTVGIALDNTSGFSGCGGNGCRLDQPAATNASTGGPGQGQYSPYPSLGFHYAQAMEESEPTHPWLNFGDDFEMLSLEMDE